MEVEDGGSLVEERGLGDIHVILEKRGGGSHGLGMLGGGGTVAVAWRRSFSTGRRDGPARRD